ncbi:MAG: cyclic nucleotide-binding domain-containing protein [Deltaproteobacteria bacterium]|jgi:CRP-like cAMP-binding protein|nr:cyclic nucleotide-binding domain-containing protein [Deltaproteobacteria bacterium]
MVEIDPFLILEEEEYNDGDVILREGTSTDWIYIVLEGQVRIQKNTPKGAVSITTLGEERVVGEMAFLEKGKVPRAASAIALGHVRLGVLDHDKLTKEYDLLSPLFKTLILTLVRRLRTVTDAAVRLVTKQ